MRDHFSMYAGNISMKFTTFLLSLCLAGLLAKPTEAGFVCIDDFNDVSAPDGVADSRSLIGVPTALSIANSRVGARAERAVFISFNFDTPYDFSASPIFELAGVIFGPAGSPVVTDVTVTAVLNSGADESAIASVPLSDGTLAFDFTGAAELASVGSSYVRLHPVTGCITIPASQLITFKRYPNLKFWCYWE